MVSDAKSEEVDIIYRMIDLSEAVVVAIGDSSFANVGKSKTASQAGLIILFAENNGNKFLKGGAAKVSALICRSHRIKRVVRSTLTAETMVALEVVESGDLIRARKGEIHGGLEYKMHAADVSRSTTMVHVTDCKNFATCCKSGVPFPASAGYSSTSRRFGTTSTRTSWGTSG